MTDDSKTYTQIKTLDGLAGKTIEFAVATPKHADDWPHDYGYEVVLKFTDGSFAIVEGWSTTATDSPQAYVMISEDEPAQRHRYALGLLGKHEAKYYLESLAEECRDEKERIRMRRDGEWAEYERLWAKFEGQRP